MEKRKPSHDLERFKAVAGDPLRLDMTRTALLSAAALGFDLPAVAALIKTVERSMFFKSMTSFTNPRQWQDVYHVPTPEKTVIYLKFTDDVVTEFTVLSFKER